MQFKKKRQDYDINLLLIMAIFNKNKNYTLGEIIDICKENNLITVDCLKDENVVSVEEEGADCLFEFLKIKKDTFRLSWQEQTS